MNYDTPIYCVSLDLSTAIPTPIQVGNDVTVWIKSKKGSSKRWVTLYIQAKKTVKIEVLKPKKEEIDP